MTDFLVLGNHTQGLGVIRSLRYSGYSVHMVNDKHICLSRFSRYLTRYHLLPRNTLSNVHRPSVARFLVYELLKIAADSSKTVVFCMDEDLIQFIYENKVALSSKFIIPDNDIDGISDKYLFAKALDAIGIPGPKTMLLSDIQELPKAYDVHPFLYKGRSGIRLKNLLNSKCAEISSSDDLARLRGTIKGKIAEHEVLIQQKLQNNTEVASCCGLAICGDLRRIFQYVKLRQHPDEFGTGTFLKSIRDHRLTEMTLKIVDHFSYTGIFEIEFIMDNDGSYNVLEMNPRTWKSIHFATDCGQNLCRAYCDYLLRGIMIEKDFKYEEGRFWVHLSTDMAMLIKNRGKRKYNRNMSFCVWDSRDPLPFFVESLLMPLLLLKV